MKRNQYVVIAVALVLAVVALAWPDNKTAATGLARIVDVPAADVKSITVISDQGRAELANRGGSDWAAGEGTPSIDQTIMYEAESRMFPVLGYRTVPGADPKDPDYGLADPEITLVIKATSGEEYGVAFGKPSFNTGGFYAKRLDRAAVHLVPRRAVDDLRSLIAGKRIDTPNVVDRKLLELDEKQANDTGEPADSSWLKQAIETEESKP